MSWDAAQLRILRELGHEPMQLAAAMGGRDVAAAATAAPPLAPVRGADPLAAATASRLLAAIVRAAAGRDLSALALDLEGLRREPALKRALWPRLRALRRGH